MTEEPTYSAVLTRISRGVGSSTEEEGDEEEEEEEEAEADADADGVDESIRSSLTRLFPARLAPETGAAVRARQRASVRVAARSRRCLRRAGEEASKGKEVPPRALPMDRGALLVAVVAAAGALFDAKVRCADAADAADTDDAAESRDDIATVQLLSIKESREEAKGRLERNISGRRRSLCFLLDLDLLFFILEDLLFPLGRAAFRLFSLGEPEFTDAEGGRTALSRLPRSLHKKNSFSPLPHHPPAPILQRPRVLRGPAREHRPRDLLRGRAFPPPREVEARPLRAGGRRE